MADVHTKEQRSRNMSAIKGSNTKPELIVRKLLHSKGYRFRLKANYLPGRPDLVLPKFKTAIFVHGCFWHRHPGCKYAYMPKTRTEFWTKKFEANIKRDAEVAQEISNKGWKYTVIWECETKDKTKLGNLIDELLNADYAGDKDSYLDTANTQSF